MSRSVARRIGSFLLLLVAGCGLFGDDAPSIGLSASPAVAVVQQGASVPIVLEIARKNFEKPVQLVIEGALPSGVIAIFTQNPVPAGTSTTTLTISASGSATPGMAALTIKATGEGVADKATLIDVTVNVRGSHTVALTSSAMNVAPGGGGQSTVLLARQNGNAGSVTLTATGAPSGMTVTFGESPTTSSATSVTVAATSAVAPGSYNITISGSQPGLTPSPAPAVLAVTVVSAPATTGMTISFCPLGMPVWFAYQNDGFLWQRVTASSNAFSFNATDKLAIAFAFQNGNASDVRFYYATRGELAGISDRDCPGPKNHPGTTTSVAAGQTAIVTLGPAFEVVNANAYVLEGVPDRALDLVATRGTLTAGVMFAPDRVVVRRGVNLANNASVPVIDYTGSESFAPVTASLSVAGVESGETVYAENLFQGTTSTSGLLFTNEGTSATQTMYTVPASVLVGGDVHELYIDAYNTAGTIAHTMVTYFSTTGDRTETLGPLLTSPSVSVVSTTPYLRERGQLPSQSAYGTAVRFVYLQGQSPSTRYVTVVMTAGHLGGAVPTTWDVLVPDLTGVAGFSSSWMHTSGQTTSYSAEGFSAPGSTLFGGLPSAGQTIRLAYRQSSVSTSVGAALREAALDRRGALKSRGGLLNPPPQYLRR